jgi:hypothetical protein
MIILIYLITHFNMYIKFVLIIILITISMYKIYNVLTTEGHTVEGKKKEQKLAVPKFLL